MFMEHNRAVNGAEQPATAAKKSASAQKGARKLAPNIPVTEDAADWRFMPDMSSPEAINSGHYQGGVSGNGPYGHSYEASIPFVGTAQDRGTHKLKG
jgi:hypothetical protein